MKMQPKKGKKMEFHIPGKLLSNSLLVNKERRGKLKSPQQNNSIQAFQM